MVLALPWEEMVSRPPLASLWLGGWQPLARPHPARQVGSGILQAWVPASGPPECGWATDPQSGWALPRDPASTA